MTERDDIKMITMRFRPTDPLYRALCLFAREYGASLAGASKGLLRKSLSDVIAELECTQ